MWIGFCIKKFSLTLEWKFSFITLVIAQFLEGLGANIPFLWLYGPKMLWSFVLVQMWFLGQLNVFCLLIFHIYSIMSCISKFLFLKVLLFLWFQGWDHERNHTYPCYHGQNWCWFHLGMFKAFLSLSHKNVF
jgi:hypothetical protein